MLPPFVDDVRRGAAGSPRTNHRVVEVNKLDLLHSSQEQCKSKTSDFDSESNLSNLSNENTPVSRPIVNCPDIDELNLLLPRLKVFGPVSSELSCSIQTKPTRVENEIWGDPAEIRGNPAFWYMKDNSKETVEENDDGQTKCNVGGYNPKTWREDKSLKYARKLVEDLEDKDSGKDDPRVLKFEEMRRQSINRPVAREKPVVGSPSSASD